VRIEAAEEWFCEMITHSTLAGRWREAGRLVPEAAEALERAADRKSALARRLRTENLGAQNRMTLVLGAFITSPGLGGRTGGDANGNCG
jgi:hypothetical protein